MKTLFRLLLVTVVATTLVSCDNSKKTEKKLSAVEQQAQMFAAKSVESFNIFDDTAAKEIKQEIKEYCEGLSDKDKELFAKTYIIWEFRNFCHKLVVEEYEEAQKEKDAILEIETPISYAEMDKITDKGIEMLKIEVLKLGAHVQREDLEELFIEEFGITNIDCDKFHKQIMESIDEWFAENRWRLESIFKWTIYSEYGELSEAQKEKFDEVWEKAMANEKDVYEAWEEALAEARKTE